MLHNIVHIFLQLDTAYKYSSLVVQTNSQKGKRDGLDQKDRFVVVKYYAKLCNRDEKF